MSRPIFLRDEEETLSFAGQFSTFLTFPMIIYLKGDLGAGKTTFVRGLLRGLSHQGKVKSPTFTLVEEYDFPQGPIYHFDLYRLTDPEELDFIGMREYVTPNAVLLIEWPEKGKGYIPKPDVILTLTVFENGRSVEIESLTENGTLLMTSIHSMNQK